MRVSGKERPLNMNKLVYMILLLCLFIFIGATVVCSIWIDILAPVSLAFLLLAVIVGIFIGGMYMSQ